MNGKKNIKFTCYEYTCPAGTFTMFLFWPDGEWDENKMTLEEALKAYPADKFEWIHTD